MPKISNTSPPTTTQDTKYGIQIIVCIPFFTLAFRSSFNINAKMTGTGNVKTVFSNPKNNRISEDFVKIRICKQLFEN